MAKPPGPLSEFQQAMIFQAVIADKMLPGDTVASQVTVISDEWDAAKYLEQLRASIEMSRDRRAKPRRESSKRKATAKKR